jgi:hypothetical protein
MPQGLQSGVRAERLRRLAREDEIALPLGSSDERGRGRRAARERIDDEAEQVARVFGEYDVCRRVRGKAAVAEHPTVELGTGKSGRKPALASKWSTVIFSRVESKTTSSPVAMSTVMIDSRISPPFSLSKSISSVTVRRSGAKSCMLGTPPESIVRATPVARLGMKMPGRPSSRACKAPARCIMREGRSQGPLGSDARRQYSRRREGV